MHTASPTVRIQRSIATAIVLAAAYWAYSSLTSPVLDVQHSQQRLTHRARQQPTSREHHDLAVRWFPEQKWVADAGMHLHDLGRYLYFGDLKLSEDRKSVSLEPVALLWNNDDDSDEVPVTLTAESARLDSSVAVSNLAPDFGEITGGMLDGNVQILGPQRLRIDGRRFSVSEDSMKLWSSRPVRFWWDNHSGSASNGVEIIMHAPADGKSGLMSVSDISEVRLLGRVTCNLRFPERRQGDGDLEMQVTASNGFEFDVDTRIATFFGFSNRSLKPEDQVLVQRLTPDARPDRLVCSQLALVLRPELSPITGEVIPNRLMLEQIVAQGERVVFHSEEYDLVAVMTELRYSADQRQMKLSNFGRDANDRPLPVRISQKGSVLRVPYIEVTHGEEGTISQIRCMGRGTIEHSESSEAMTASWLRDLTIRQQGPDQQRVVSLNGRASVENPGQHFRLGAETISMKLREDQTQQRDRSHQSTASGKRSLELGSLKPELLQAFGDVSLNSPKVSGKVRQQLTVAFAEESGEPGNNIQTVSAEQTMQTEQEAAGVDGEPMRPEVSFSADTLLATVHLQDQSLEATGRSSGQGVSLSNLWLKGDVSVERWDDDPSRAFVATGNALHAAGGLQNTREIELFGDPAKASTGTLELEGQRIDLSEVTNRFEVNGSGKIRLITDKGLDGKVLPQPAPLDIYWTESMTFQGRMAHFVGNIRAVLKDQQTVDLEMKCSGLKVYFTKEVSLNQNAAGGGFNVSSADGLTGQSDETAVEMERVECESRVDVRIDQLVNGEVQSRHRASLADLVVNVISGEFGGIGPGWISSTTPDTRARRRVASTVHVGVNTPAVVRDTGFTHVRASFIGELKGNLNDRFANLSHHVTGVVAPVQHLDQQVAVETIPTTELPDRVGIIRAEKLSISAIRGSAAGEETFALTARENARVESREFSGDADVITYDDSKQQFILRAEQDRMATVRHRPGQTSEFQTINGKRFEYYPAPRNQLIANQIAGVQASE